jgi:hypothetical protein
MPPGLAIAVIASSQTGPQGVSVLSSGSATQIVSGHAAIIGSVADRH